jgi:chromate transporter
LPGPLLEIAVVFLKLGLIAVGGPAVHVALMRRELVVKRRWVDEKTFLDDFAACQLIPGPSSTELAILLGYRRGGPAGLIAAGVPFILPAFVIMLALAWLYSRFASSATIAGALYGVRPIVVGLIGWALVDLGRRILRGPFLAFVGVAVLVAALLGVNPILLLLAGGVALVVRRRAGGTLMLVASAGAINTSLLGVFLTFLKYGAVSFGSGYVLFALLHADVVQSYHWLTTRQLVDAIAISQATPGPVFTVATFIGFLVAGLGGAALATVGIFLPGFVLVPFLERIVRLVNQHDWAKAFLDGVNVAALGLIAEVAIQLGRAALIDPVTVAVAIVSFALLLRAPLFAPVLVVLGAVLGVLLAR